MQTKNSTPESNQSKKSINNPRPSIQFSTAETKVSHALRNNTEASLRLYTNSEEPIDTMELIEEINQSQSQYLSFQSLNRDQEKDLQNQIEQKLQEHKLNIKNLQESFDKKLQIQTSNLSQQFFQLQQNLQNQYFERFQTEKLQHETIEYNLKQQKESQIKNLEIQTYQLNEQLEQQMNNYEEEKIQIQEHFETKIYELTTSHELLVQQIKNQYMDQLQQQQENHTGEIQIYKDELEQKSSLINEYENTQRQMDVRIRQLMDQNQQIFKNFKSLQDEVNQQKEIINFHQQENMKLKDIHHQETSKLQQNLEIDKRKHEQQLKLIQQNLQNEFIPQEELKNQLKMLNQKQIQYEDYMQQKFKKDKDQYQNNLQKLQQDNQNLNLQIKQSMEEIQRLLDIQKSLKQQIDELQCNQINEEEYHEILIQNQQLTLQLESYCRRIDESENSQNLISQIKDLSQRNQQLQNQLNELQDLFNKQKTLSQFQNIWANNQTQEISIKALQDELKTRNSHNQEITREVQKKNKIIEDLQKKVQVLSNHIEKPNKELEQVFYKLSNAVEMIKFINSLEDKCEIERLSSDEDNKNKQEQSLKKWQNQIEYILNQFKKCKFDSVKSQDQYNSQFLILTQQFEEMKEQLKDFKNQNQVLENYIKNLKLNIGKLNDEKMRSEEKIADLEVQTSLFQKQIPPKFSRDLFPKENSGLNSIKEQSSKIYVRQSQSKGQGMKSQEQIIVTPREISFQD